MTKHITVLIKYEDGQEQPSFHANMDLLGGVVEGVMFADGLARIDELEQEIEDADRPPGQRGGGAG